MMRDLLMAGLVLLGGLVRGQDGTNDATFNPLDAGNGQGDGATSTVRGVALQPDGKALIWGALSMYNYRPSNRIARVQSNGLSDQGFMGPNLNGDIYSAAIQPDGKIIAGGDFTTVGSTPLQRLMRLNSDGTRDVSYMSPGNGFNGRVHAIAIQSDGKAVIGGAFTQYNTTPWNGLARMTVNGSIDGSLVTGTGANGIVHVVQVTSTGKILIAGTFTSYNGTVSNRIARLNSNGTIDAAFNPGTGADGTVFTMQLLPDGRILIGGAFDNYNGIARNGLALLSADGALDGSFNPGVGADGNVFAVARQGDGKFLIGGDFANLGGSAQPFLGRLNSDGSADTGYAQGTGPSAQVLSLAVRADGTALIGGTFVRYDGIIVKRFAHLNANGTLDTAFNPNTGADDIVQAVLVLDNGKIMIGGRFKRYNGVECNSFALLNNDGTLDPSFAGGTGGENEWVHTIVRQPDGKVLVGGGFLTFNGSPRRMIARLNSDGSLDQGFVPPSIGTNNTVSDIAVRPDGKILICGTFSNIGGSGINGLALLNTDGSLNTSFNTGIQSVGYAVALQVDGKVIATTFSIPRIRRFNADGTSDPSFMPGNGPNSAPYDLVVQPDGKIIAVGPFLTNNSVNTGSIIRLLPDGAVDASFDTGAGPGGTFGHSRTVSLLPDGKLMLGGNFTTYNGVARSGLARLNADGSLDLSFDPGTGVQSISWPNVYSFGSQPDGKLVVAGMFTSYNGTGRNRIARINNTVSAGSGIRVLLEGPYTNGLMNDALRTLPSFPLTEPFSAMDYANAAYSAGATIVPSVMTTTGDNAIVDWVLVEMRPAAAPGTIAAARAALLQRDGDVVALDGTGPVTFPGLANGSYCLAVRPRNHLPVMLATTAPVNYSGSALAVDFTLAGTQVYNSDARKNVGGVQVLAAGDVTFNGTISYTGNANDRDPILTRVGGVNPTATLGGYWREDVNMDGVVKYTGAGNDRDLVLLSVGGVVPTNTRVAPLP